MAKRELDEDDATTKHETPSSDKKRRRSTEHEEVEIDVNLPEPPSKKAKRKEKKSSSKPAPAAVTHEDATDPAKKEASKKKEPSALALAAPDLPKPSSTSNPLTPSQKRSDHGIWIGNLAFSTTKEKLIRLLEDEGGIAPSEILRIHLPTEAAATTAPAAKKNGLPPRNKGFAYIDFSSQPVLEAALGLSERLLDGRRVLIKNSKSFEGRPAKSGEVGGKKNSRMEPSRRVFVGNLGFDVSKDELSEHFGQAGEVEDIFMATFEDSGKCKGFGWVRFGEVEAAEAAVRGFFYQTADTSNEGCGDEDDDIEIITEEGDQHQTQPKRKDKDKDKRQKHFINKLNGRLLRCEFAEDAQTRYKKRYGKDKDSGGSSSSRPEFQRARASPDYDVGGGQIAADAVVGNGGGGEGLAQQAAAAREKKDGKKDRDGKKGKEGQGKDKDKEQRREDRKKRHDATTAAADSLAPQRAQVGGMITGTGKKISFD